MISACNKYAPKMYMGRHNAALRIPYFHLRESYDIDKEPVFPYASLEIEKVVEKDMASIYFSTIQQILIIKPDIVLCTR